ncbi:MAG TPA: hypothetical protein VM264_02745, partial [Acidimicrobiales bacterium]|nr:hypothetical protein [Acidimicrobiales bacterium]
MRRRLGHLAEARPAPSPVGAAAALGGALLAGALTAVAFDSWAATGSAALALALTGGVLAAALLALASPASLPRPVVPAAVAASGLAVPAFSFFTAGAGGDFPSLRPVAVLAGLALAALYLVGPSPGHTFHLALLAAAVWLGAVALTGPAGFLLRTGTLADALVTAGLVSAAVGGAQLAAGRWLDGAGLAGMATPLLGVGAAAATAGATVVWIEAGPPAAVAPRSAAPCCGPRSRRPPPPPSPWPMPSFPAAPSRRRPWWSPRWAPAWSWA